MTCPDPEAHGAEGVDDPGSPSSCLETSAFLYPPLQDLLWAISFYFRFFLSYIPFYGVSGAVILYVVVR